jgi:hypothetical protein
LNFNSLSFKVIYKIIEEIFIVIEPQTDIMLRVIKDTFQVISPFANNSRNRGMSSNKYFLSNLCFGKWDYMVRYFYSYLIILQCLENFLKSAIYDCRFLCSERRFFFRIIFEWNFLGFNNANWPLSFLILLYNNQRSWSRAQTFELFANLFL